MTAQVEPLVKRSSTLQEAILTTLARTGTDGSTRANLAVAFAASASSTGKQYGFLLKAVPIARLLRCCAFSTNRRPDAAGFISQRMTNGLRDFSLVTERE